METELETQLKQAEQQVRELRTANHRLLLEHTSVKVVSPSLRESLVESLKVFLVETGNTPQTNPFKNPQKNRKKKNPKNDKMK